MKQGLPLTPKTTKGARRKWDTAKQSLQATKATLQGAIHTAEEKEYVLETRLAEVTLPRALVSVQVC